MTNPYSLRVLAQAREEDIRRSALGRQHVPPRARRSTSFWSALPKHFRRYRRPVGLRVVASPLERTCRG